MPTQATRIVPPTPNPPCLKVGRNRVEKNYTFRMLLSLLSLTIGILASTVSLETLVNSGEKLVPTNEHFALALLKSSRGEKPFSIYASQADVRDKGISRFNTEFKKLTL